MTGRPSHGPLWAARYHLGDGLMRLSLLVLPSKRYRTEVGAILRAYRSGVEAAVLLHELEDMRMFKGDAPPGLKVADVHYTLAGAPP